VTVSWNAASDPNGDNITYNIYYYNGVSTTTLASATTTTSFAWGVSAVADGSYGLKGEACDDDASPLCTDFYLTANISLDKTDPVYSLSDISISSDNDVTTLAKAGDTVTLSFTSGGNIAPTLDVEFYSGGSAINDTVSSSSLSNVWTVTYVVDASDSDGTIDYLITADNLDFQYSSSTLVTVDLTAPGAISASPAVGTYIQAQNVSLSSSNSYLIRYTLDGTDPTCSTGNLYADPLNIASSLTIRAIACDRAGNATAVSAFQYSIVYGSIISSPPTSGSGAINTTTDMEETQSTGAITTENTKSIQSINYEGKLIKYNDSPKVYLIQNGQKRWIINEESFIFNNYKWEDIKLIDSGTFYQDDLNIIKLTDNKKTYIFSRDLKFGMTGSDVKELQKYLNNNGSVLIVAGPGSPGQETEFFGSLTRQALIKFQKDNSIIPAQGYFGPITRAFINNAN